MRGSPLLERLRSPTADLGAPRHGAFTKALLTCLSDQSLMRPVDPTAPDRSIRYGTLSFAMPDQIASLLKAAGQPQTLEEPVIPLEDLAIDVPVVVAR